MSDIIINIFKFSVTAALIVAFSEMAKRWSFIATLAPSIPIGGALIAMWLYFDTRDSARAAHYSWNVLLLVPPGCVFLAALPLCIRAGMAFWPSFAIAVALTAATYWIYTLILQRVFGVVL